jgi:hypothetical protein
MSKRARRGRVFADAMPAFGQTIVAPYAIRPRPHAPARPARHQGRGVATGRQRGGQTGQRCQEPVKRRLKAGKRAAMQVALKKLRSL